VPTEFQHFWRCAHHPSALQNFQDERTECMWECHTQELKSWHNGSHPMPKSWPPEILARNRRTVTSMVSGD